MEEDTESGEVAEDDVKADEVDVSEEGSQDELEEEQTES